MAGDKARRRTTGTRPRGTHPLPVLTHTVSVQLLLVPSWPVAHLPSPRVPLATCEHRSLIRWGRSCHWLSESGSNGCGGPPQGGSWPARTPPLWESLRPGQAGGGPLMPNRLRQLRFMSDARRQRDFQDGAERSDREKRYANTSREYEAFRKRTCEATENERSKLYIRLIQHPYFTS